ncbi:MAG: hypothetical protein GY859_34505, partial [Desulfobacterales bacterium]|nr:hypothetical protein [Desulfobacterales bacterium]
MTSENKERVLIGGIVGVHGLKGALKARLYAESLSIFQPGDSIHVKNPGGG